MLQRTQFLFLALAFRLNQVAALEQSAIDQPVRFAAIVLFLTIFLALARWHNRDRNTTEDDFVRFEEDAEPVIQGLGLNHDGVLAATFATYPTGS